ncbi:MAG: hypothetical protein K0R10_2446 [Alphaproteobacteria bacterium]|jgi:hypothetical protein|nr:hypothetical protein [Alphaproteobacteria bacterium]
MNPHALEGEPARTNKFFKNNNHKKGSTQMKTKISHKLAAAATLGMFAGHANAADAATTFRDMTTNIITASSGFNNLISVVCWIGGAGLGVAGIFKLKNHVDNPGQTPMKDGLVRLGCGGALLAFPFIQQAMQGSIANGSMQRLNAASLQMDSVTVFGQ